MDELKFWEIVGSAHDQSDGNMDEKCDLIRTVLSKLPKDDARAFSVLFDAMMDRAYSWPLWGAAYVINGGCGDDTFSDFRASLISRGRTAFESALTDPESLATEDFDEDAWFYEGYTNILIAVDKMYQAIRKDLGNSNFGLQTGDLLKSMLSDPENWGK